MSKSQEKSDQQYGAATKKTQSLKQRSKASEEQPPTSLKTNALTKAKVPAGPNFSVMRRMHSMTPPPAPMQSHVRYSNRPRSLFWTGCIPMMLAFLFLLGLFLYDKYCLGGKYMNMLMGRGGGSAAPAGESMGTRLAAWLGTGQENVEPKKPDKDGPRPWLARIWNFSFVGFTEHVFCYWVDGGTEMLIPYQYAIILGVMLLVCVTLALLIIANKAQKARQESRYEAVATFLTFLVVLAGYVFFVHAQRHDERRHAERKEAAVARRRFLGLPLIVVLILLGILVGVVGYFVYVWLYPLPVKVGVVVTSASRPGSQKAEAPVGVMEVDTGPEVDEEQDGYTSPPAAQRRPNNPARPEWSATPSS